MRVPEEIQRSASAQAAAAVHGITDEEIALGTTFPAAWARFLAFVEACSNNMIQESEEDTDEEPLLPRPLCGYRHQAVQGGKLYMYIGYTNTHFKRIGTMVGDGTKMP